MEDEDVVEEEFLRRNVPGTKEKVFPSIILIYIEQDLFSWPPQELDAMESSLSVQQYIQQMIRKNPADVAALVTLPEDVDEKLWQYEHLR